MKKGPVPESGYGFQKIYDVAWSDGRKPDKSGKLPPSGFHIGTLKQDK